MRDEENTGKEDGGLCWRLKAIRVQKWRSRVIHGMENTGLL